MKWRLLDAGWLVLLVALVFAIPPTFHGDEAMLTYASRDFSTAFVERNPAALTTEPPYQIDSDPHLRILNGSVHRYLTGLLWTLAGATPDQLPPRPGWDWGLDYATNVATGHYPNPTQLGASRLVSSLFLAGSIVVMFALGWRFGGRFPAWGVSGLYAVNPILLLNGRRGMQEGTLLFFGLLVIWVAASISQRRSENKPVPLWLWLALVLAGGLALASKHPAVVFVAGAFGWVLLTELFRRNGRDLLLTGMKLAAAGVLVIALFIALSPALWLDPPARIGNLLDSRTEMLNIQVSADPVAPTTLAQRISDILTQPYMTPPLHYEVASWATFPEVSADVARYMASPFSGVQFGVVLGGLLMLMAGVGIFFSLRRNWRAGVLVWLLVTAASLLVNPLPWQRYFIPLIPVVTLLSGIGIEGLARRLRVR